jgi:hypothetical protein
METMKKEHALYEKRVLRDVFVRKKGEDEGNCIITA